MHGRWTKWLNLNVGLLALALIFHPVSARCGSIPAVGSPLPEFRMQAPQPGADTEYLGIGDVETFGADQLDCRITLIEIVGVYCPQCHVQAPLFNTLFHRIQRNSELSRSIKMLAIAVGATPMETDFMKKEFKIPFPVISDPQFEIHKLLGEPRTPFTMLVAGDNKVVYAHLGVIENIDDFLSQIQKFIQ